MVLTWGAFDMRLTDKIVRDLPLPERGYRITPDDGQAGFGARITANGARSFVLTYRRKSDGVQRTMTIGAFPTWSVVAARDEAKRLRRDVDSGGDPLGAIDAARDAPTVNELCDRFLEEYVPRKRPGTAKDYSNQIKSEVRPALGRMKVADVQFRDVDRLHRKISKRAPVAANRMVAMLSKMFSMAVRWGMRADNPCKGIEKNPEEKRSRYLSGDEMARLTVALANLRDQDAANAIRLLLLTGARRGELLRARWRDVNLERATWSKPASTTKQNKLHVVPLSAPACQLLAAMRARAGDAPEWVFPAVIKPGPRTNLDWAWNEARTAANISDIRLHDLRHSFASQLASSGASLPLIGALLGHATPTMTARYAHLFDDPQRAAVERVGAILSGQPSAKVIGLKD
jgi:integrase